VTPEQEALLLVVRTLEQLGIPHMVTGSVASSFHGRPRATHDADVVIDPSPEQLDAFVRALQDGGFHADLARARDALRRRLQFNVIETETAFKVDLIFRKERPWSREELARRQTVELAPGALVSLASAEDTILSKLEWSRKAGGSAKQVEDAAGVLEVNPGVDRSYIERWAHELAVTDLWHEILEGRARPR
jgi:hypothetical protein